MIIEDEVNQIRSLGMILSAKGHKAYYSSSGEAGLKVIEEFQIDVVLLDLRLKDRSGLELIPRIRKLQPETVVLVVTGDTETGGQQALDLGADGYLQKPIHPDELLKTIQALMDAKAKNIPRG
jgi:DNA-binding response OmpR family regulator